MRVYEEEALCDMSLCVQSTMGEGRGYRMTKRYRYRHRSRCNLLTNELREDRKHYSEHQEHEWNYS